MGQYIITGGPTKFEMLLSLFDGDSGHRRVVEFLAKNPGDNERKLPYSRRVVLNKVTRKDGTKVKDNGEEWLFEGCFEGFNGPFIRGFYSTLDHKGWFEFFS